MAQRTRRRGGSAFPVIPRFHLIVGAEALARPDFERDIDEIDAVGTPVAVHLRARDLGGGRLLEAARRIRGRHLVLLINDRVDVALAANAQGVHLAQHSVDAETARGLIGTESLIGASVHGLREAQAARVVGADFVIVGSMFPTLSHPGRAPEGVTILTDIVEGTSHQCVAIGGISPEQVEVLCSLGAHGVAARSGVWDHPRPSEAVVRYLDSLARAAN